MDISLINSQSLFHLLSLTEKKEELLQIVGQIDAEIIRTLKGGISLEVVEIASSSVITRPAPAAKNPVAVTPVKTVKPAKAKRTMSAEGRARISAATKARWAARRADKAAKVVVAPKAGKPAKVKKKSGLTPEGRAKLAANMKARWAARRAAKA
ncbi:MAG: hypothetical protein NTV93_11535 [Verrucomicrobia bacterium]|nr:hypothetical protein [Verrucomicrobiota bacterium]